MFFSFFVDPTLSYPLPLDADAGVVISPLHDIHVIIHQLVQLRVLPNRVPNTYAFVELKMLIGLRRQPCLRICHERIIGFPALLQDIEHKHRHIALVAKGEGPPIEDSLVKVTKRGALENLDHTLNLSVQLLDHILTCLHERTEVLDLLHHSIAVHVRNALDQLPHNGVSVDIHVITRFQDITERKVCESLKCLLVEVAMLIA